MEARNGRAACAIARPRRSGTRGLSRGAWRSSRKQRALRPSVKLATGASAMYLSNQSLLVIIVVGIVAGWLAGRVMEGGGFGLIGDLLVGLVGAFIGDWLLPRLGIHLGAGIVSLIINAFIGAVVLLLILRLLGGGWGR